MPPPPEQSRTDVRCADARSRNNRSPKGVTAGFKVRSNKIEPTEPNRALNLFSNNESRLTVSDEAGKSWPKVPLVGKAAL